MTYAQTASQPAAWSVAWVVHSTLFLGGGQQHCKAPDMRAASMLGPVWTGPVWTDGICWLRLRACRVVSCRVLSCAVVSELRVLLGCGPN